MAATLHKRPPTHRWWLDFLTRVELQPGGWYPVVLLWLDFLQFSAPVTPISYNQWWADLQSNLLVGCQFTTRGPDRLGSVRLLEQGQLYRTFDALYPLK